MATMTAAQFEAQAMQLIRANARPFRYTILNSQGIDPTTTQTVQTQAFNNGSLITGFEVVVSATITAGSSAAATLTQRGVFNLVNNFKFTDYLQNVRIQNVPGSDLATYNAIARGRYVRSSNPQYTGATSSVAANVIASNLIPGVLSAPASVPEGTSATVTVAYEIPIARPGTLVGALPGSVNSGQYSSPLDITLANATQAGLLTDVYSSGTLSNFSIKVHQKSYTNLPTLSGGVPVYLPISSNTLYLLSTSNSATLNPGAYTSLSFDAGYAYLSQILSLVSPGATSYVADLSNFDKLTIQGDTNQYDTIYADDFAEKMRNALNGGDMLAGQIYLPLSDYRIGQGVGQLPGVGSGQWYKQMQISSSAASGTFAVTTSEKLQMSSNLFTPTGPTQSIG